MRCIVEPLKTDQSPPTLRIFVHGAPHRRQHIQVIERYRKELMVAMKAAKIRTPIRCDIDLWVLFIDPCSCDLDNLIAALYRAMDGHVLVDDSLIQHVEMSKFYPCAPTKSEPARTQKTKRA
jgi:Holliday junction resolvase RusA-like endonuclease